MKKIKEIIGLPIISIFDGTEIGMVKNIIINAEDRSVSYLVVENGLHLLGAKVIATDRVLGIGEHAVTVEDDGVVSMISKIPAAMDLLEKNVQIKGSKVLTKKGKLVGEITEIYVDEDDCCLIKGMEFLPLKGDGEVKYLPDKSIVTYGRHLIIVTDAYESAVLEISGDLQQTAPVTDASRPFDDARPSAVTASAKTAPAETVGISPVGTAGSAPAAHSGAASVAVAGTAQTVISGSAPAVISGSAPAAPAEAASAAISGTAQAVISGSAPAVIYGSAPAAPVEIAPSFIAGVSAGSGASAGSDPAVVAGAASSPAEAYGAAGIITRDLTEKKTLDAAVAYSPAPSETDKPAITAAVSAVPAAFPAAGIISGDVPGVGETSAAPQTPPVIKTGAPAETGLLFDNQTETRAASGFPAETAGLPAYSPSEAKSSELKSETVSVPRVYPIGEKPVDSISEAERVPFVAQSGLKPEEPASGAAAAVPADAEGVTADLAAEGVRAAATGIRESVRSSAGVSGGEFTGAAAKITDAAVENAAISVPENISSATAGGRESARAVEPFAEKTATASGAADGAQAASPAFHGAVGYAAGSAAGVTAASAEGTRTAAGAVESEPDAGAETFERVRSNGIGSPGFGPTPKFAENKMTSAELAEGAPSALKAADSVSAAATNGASAAMSTAAGLVEAVPAAGFTVSGAVRTVGVEGVSAASPAAATAVGADAAGGVKSSAGTAEGEPATEPASAEAIESVRAVETATGVQPAAGTALSAPASAGAAEGMQSVMTAGVRESSPSAGAAEAAQTAASGTPLNGRDVTVVSAGVSAEISCVPPVALETAETAGEKDIEITAAAPAAGLPPRNPAASDPYSTGAAVLTESHTVGSGAAIDTFNMDGAAILNDSAEFADKAYRNEIMPDMGSAIAADTVENVSRRPFNPVYGANAPAEDEPVAARAGQTEPVKLAAENTAIEHAGAGDSASAGDAAQRDNVIATETTLFEQRQRRYLTGRIVTKTILDNKGNVIVESGVRITEDVIDQVRESGRMVQLVMNNRS